MLQSSSPSYGRGKMHDLKIHDPEGPDLIPFPCQKLNREQWDAWTNWRATID